MLYSHAIGLLISICLTCQVTNVLAQSARTEDVFTLALTGDSIITRRLSIYKEPEYMNMINILRSADAAFTNLEILFHDYESYPTIRGGLGTYMRADPALAQELAWAGFDLVSRANNHTNDYGALGLTVTTKYVEQAGLVHAGAGRSLAEAREAKFLATPNARIALISAASTYPQHYRAGESRGDIPARPGLSPLRYTATYFLPEQDIGSLNKIGKSLGLVQETDKKTTGIQLFGQEFLTGQSAKVVTKAHAGDLLAIAAVVEDASRQADKTVVSIHAHEAADKPEVPAQFIMDFAHRMIDAGADVVVGHGPHILRGIEIYDGKPIFYSLGNFIFQLETVLRLPPENYERQGLGHDANVADYNDARYSNGQTGYPVQPKVWQSVIAVPAWQNGNLVELKLHPVSLQFGQPRTVRGRPLLADSQIGREIIRDLQRLSQPFGTSIQYSNGVGLVELK